MLEHLAPEIVGQVLAEEALNLLRWAQQSKAWQEARKRKQQPVGLSEDQLTFAMAVAKGQVLAKTKGQLPAPLAALDAIAKGCNLPLPEGLPELSFAGALGGQRVRLIRRPASGEPFAITLAADADFCITGTVDPDEQLPEGPFGDHLGYYSLAHPFPVLNVERVSHRDGAIWPFTVVGRPPPEATQFG